MCLGFLYLLALKNSEEMKFTAINSGILAAVINLVILLIMYAIGPATFGSTWTGILMMVYSCAILIFLGLKGRKENGGFFTWFEAFKYLLIVTAIFMVGSTVCNMVLFNLIDPDFMVKVKEITIEKTVTMMEGFGLSESQLDETVVGIEESFEDRMSIGGQLKGLGIGVVVMAVINCLLALIIKKNRPEFAE